MTFGWHWRRVTFAVLHSKLLQAIFEVFFLRYEDVVALLTDLETVGDIPRGVTRPQGITRPDLATH